MNMDINETGKHSGMMKINGDITGRGVQPPGNGNNTAVRHRKVNRTETVFRKQRSVFQQIAQGTRSFPGPAAGANQLSDGFLSDILYLKRGAAVNTKIVKFSPDYFYTKRAKSHIFPPEDML